MDKLSFDGSFVFGTKKFNEKSGRNDRIDQIEVVAKDYFIDKDTDSLKTEMAEERVCPICGGEEHDELFKKIGFRHVKCRCGFIYVNPTANDDCREEYDRKSHEWADILLSEEQIELDRKKFQYGIEFINKYTGFEKGKIVDAGAGSGLFLQVARDNGWGVSGVEFNEKSVQEIKAQGIEVFDQPLESGIYEENSVDVVTAWEVLEHINDPNKFIRDLHGVIKQDGYIFICVPNINALVTRLLHDKSRTFYGYAHVNFFSIDTLTAILENNGFAVEKFDTIITEIGAIKNYLSYEPPYSGDATEGLDFITPEFIFDNFLGSRIIMLARKI